MNKKLSTEHKIKISKALKGRMPKNLSVIQKMDRTERNKKISKTLKGHSVSDLTKEKIRKHYKYHVPLTAFKKGEMNGSNHPLWKGGKINYLKKQAKVRDDYTCQICGLRDMEIMEVDHIKPQSTFPELKNDFENLLTLCPNCHRRKTLRDRKVTF